MKLNLSFLNDGELKRRFGIRPQLFKLLPIKLVELVHSEFINYKFQPRPVSVFSVSKPVKHLDDRFANPGQFGRRNKGFQQMGDSRHGAEAAAGEDLKPALFPAILQLLDRRDHSEVMDSRKGAV